MKKLLKISGITFGIVFVLFVLAVVAATVMIDTNEYREKISTYVKQETGRDLLIKGDLSLSFFPWVGLTIGETTLSNAAGFGEKSFAKFNEINLKVKLLPLLSKSVEMDTVTLDGVMLNLAKNKKGVSNWDDLLKAGGKPQHEKGDRGDGGEGLKSLQIGGIHIKDAQLSWRDDQAGVAYEVADLQLNTGAINPSKPVDMNLDFDIKDNKANKSWHFGLGGRLSADMDKQQASISQLKLQLANITLKGDLQVTQMMTTPQISAKLTSSEFVPRETMASFGIAMPVTTDATVFGKAMLELMMSANAEKVDVSQLLVRLDETTLKGSMDIANFSQPAIRAQIDIDQIDVDRYLPPVAGQQEKKDAKAPASDAIELPVEMLRELNVKANLKIGKMKVSNLRSEAINMTLTANKGLIRVHPSSAKMYQGSYAGDISLDVRGKVLKVTMNEKLNGIQASPLFKDLANLDWIGGKGDMTATLAAQGNTMTALRSSLAGNIGMSFLDGVIKGVNVSYKIRQAYALLKGLPAPAAEPNETPFTSITATATVKNGVVDNRDMKMDTPVLVVTGAGQADLGKESMSYLVKATVNEKLADSESEAMQKLKGKTIPLRIEGPFSKLKYKVELDAAVKEEVKEKAKAKIEKELNDKMGDKLKDKFKGLF